MKKIMISLFLSFALLFSTFTPVCKGQTSSSAYDFSTAEQSVINAWENFYSSAEISDLRIPESEFQNLRNYITNRNSKYFYVEISNGYSYILVNNQRFLAQLNFVYSFEQHELDDRVAEFENKCAEILGNMSDGFSTEEKLLYFHDYIANKNVYDLRVYEGVDTSKDKFIRNAYGCLINKKSVCEGISKAFKVLCDKAGIECHIVYSTSMRHEWNLVKVGNNYYHIDVTQDAPVYNLGAHGFHQSPGDINHKFFLKSDEEIMNGELGNSVHYSWDAPYKATDSTTFKNAFWNEANDGVYFVDGWYYYTTPTHFKKFRYYDKQSVNIYSINNTTWKCGCGNLHVWRGEFSKTTFVPDYKILYTIGNKVCCYNIKTNTCSIIYAHQDTGFYYSVLYKNDLFYVSIRDDAYHNNEIHKFFIDVKEVSVSMPSDSVVTGDVNGDNNMNVSDIASLRNHLLRHTAEINKENTDVYYDKKIDTKDLLYLRKLLAINRG